MELPKIPGLPDLKMPDFNFRDFSATIDKVRSLPGGLGPRAMSLAAGLLVPHAARMGFRVDSLTKRSIAVTMPDKRSNRNHLKSLHAMALAHLGEFTCGLLLLYAVSPEGYRTILVKYEIEYLHKARGPITGRATLELPSAATKAKKSKTKSTKPQSLDKKDMKVVAELTDRSGTVVARTTTTWRIGKIPS